MKNIVTLTMNPAIDKSASVERIAPEIKLSCHDVRRDPGGGGINVSRVIKRLGGTTLPLFPVGGLTGQLLESLLANEGISFETIPIHAMTRENFTAYDETTTFQFRYGMPGADMTQEEWQRSLETLQKLVVDADFIVASGSLPPGVPADFFMQVAQIAQQHDAKLVLDTSGEPLHRAVYNGGVYLVKPNVRELQLLAGEDVTDDDHLKAVAMNLVQQGKANIIVVSLGAGGAWFFSQDHFEYIRTPTVPIHSKVGAGDSMVGGIVYGLANDWPLRDAARYGVAAGAAAVMTPGTQLCRAEDVQRLYEQIQV